MATHALAWTHLWRRCDLDLELAEPDHIHRTLRLHIFHLLQTVSPHTIDLDVGVPARGWHGEAYRGHVFWDELFVFPFLNLRVPGSDARAAALPLPAAAARRARQRGQAGFRGAMYPWQSGSDGREESQRLHLNPRSGRWLPDDIAAAAARQRGHRLQRLAVLPGHRRLGVPVLLRRGDAARDRPLLGEHRQLRTRRCGRYEIRGVMGPDEYHDALPGPRRARARQQRLHQRDGGLGAVHAPGGARAAAARAAPTSCCERLRAAAARSWRAGTTSAGKTAAAVPRGRRHQPVRGLRAAPGARLGGATAQRYGDIQRLDRILEAEGDTPNRYKLSKQADVLMLFYLFSAEELRGALRAAGLPVRRRR